MRQSARVVPVLVLLLAQLACSGGGGGGGGGTPTEPPQSSLDFTGEDAGSSSISLRSGAASTSSTLFLEVVATDVVDLYGVAFDLLFPGNLLGYEGVVEGSFLEGAGGVETTLQAVESATGRLILGASRLGLVAGVSGSGVIMTLQFSAAGNGSGPFTFDQNEARDASGQEMPDVSWAAGSVTVQL